MLTECATNIKSGHLEQDIGGICSFDYGEQNTNGGGITGQVVHTDKILDEYEGKK